MTSLLLPGFRFSLSDSFIIRKFWMSSNVHDSCSLQQLLSNFSAALSALIPSANCGLSKHCPSIIICISFRSLPYLKKFFIDFWREFSLNAFLDQLNIFIRWTNGWKNHVTMKHVLEAFHSISEPAISFILIRNRLITVPRFIWTHCSKRVTLSFECWRNGYQKSNLSK